MKRIIAMTLILALTLTLFTGCSKTGSKPDGNAQPESTSTASETENKTAYQATFLKLPDGLDTVQSSVFTDGALFLAAMNPSDQTTQEIDETTGAVYGYRSYVSTLYREDLKTGAIDVLELLVEGYGQPQVNALAKAADGSVWAVCQTFEQEPQDGDYIWSFVHFSPDGAETLLDRKHTLQTHWYGHVYTLLVVIFGFVLFRAESVPQALMLLRAMLTGFAPVDACRLALRNLLTAGTVFWCLAGVLACLPLWEHAKARFDGSRWFSPALDALTIVGLLLCLMQLASHSFQPFIYASF